MNYPCNGMILLDALVFYCYCNKLPQTQYLKTQFCVSQVQAQWFICAFCSRLCSRPQKAGIYLLTGLNFYLKIRVPKEDPNSFRLLVRFSSLKLWCWGPHFLAGCQPGAGLCFWKLLILSPIMWLSLGQWVSSLSVFESCLLYLLTNDNDSNLIFKILLDFLIH